VSEALSARWFELDEGSEPWPCAPDALARAKFRIVKVVEIDPTELIGAGVQYAWSESTPTLYKIKEALEQQRGQAIPLDALRKAVDGAINKGLIVLADPATRTIPTTEALLNLRVRLPKATLRTEAALTPKQIQDFANIVSQLKQAAPELEFAFWVSLTAEGERPSEAVLAKLNALLDKVRGGWKLEE